MAIVHKTNQGYSGKDLYRLKESNPELFGGSTSTPNAYASPDPPGYKEIPGNPDWLVNNDKKVYFHRSTQGYYCRDPNTGEQYELHVGGDFSSSCSIRCDAYAKPGKDASSASSTSKHVLIHDLHRAAAAMKLDMSHHDAPAAMYAIFDGNVAGAAVAESAAKGLHMRLVPALAAYRGRWTYDRMTNAVRNCIEALSLEIGSEDGIGVAVAVVVGHQLTMAASKGASCTLFCKEGAAGGGDVEVRTAAGKPSTQCVVLDDDHIGCFLTVEAVRTGGVTSAQMRTLSMPRLRAEQPRAACMKVVQRAAEGQTAPMVAAAMCLKIQDMEREAPASKKARMEKNKVRARHILVRHTGSRITGREQMKAKPKRTLAEAEAVMLGLLEELTRAGPAQFTAKCKAMSECDSGKKGGDLAGDLGWLDPDPAKNRTVPPPVTKAAFQLNVNQLSDIVVSERGIHLILRSA